MRILKSNGLKYFNGEIRPFGIYGPPITLFQQITYDPYYIGCISGNWYKVGFFRYFNKL